MLNGLQMESHIIDTHVLHKSSKFQDVSLDIDAWDGDTSVSIKTQHTALRTGNLALEFELMDANGAHINSWFSTGMAQEYWFVVGDTIYVYDANKLKEFVRARWDTFKITRLTNKKLIQENLDQGRHFSQSSCYLVPMYQISHLLERELFL